MLVSNGRRCGLPASVQVSGTETLPCVVPAPTGGVQVEATEAGTQVMRMLVTSPAPTVPAPPTMSQRWPTGCDAIVTE